MASLTPFDGPIPGENFTSDTRNYPWHRPPDITDMDAGIELLAKTLMEEEASFGIITLLSVGVDVASIVDMIITAGIGGGKWTPDFGVLLAGPCAHIIVLMAKGYDIEYDLGLESPKKLPGKSFFNAIRVDQERAEKAGENVAEQIEEEVKTPVDVSASGGFMSPMNSEEGLL